jgi:HSP20 family protein
MKLVNYDPWNQIINDNRGVLNRLRNQLNQIFDQDLSVFTDGGTDIMTSNWSPSVDIREEDDKYVFIADIPGVDPKKIEVTAENGTLTIKGEREEEKKEEKKGYKRVERSWGSFYRRFNLPDNVSTDKIVAKSKNGVLELTLPKTEVVKPKKIAVQA